MPGKVAAPPAPAEGPALAVPQPVAANGAQEQIDELRRRVDQLEQRVKELERALAESKK
jgi:ubiquinone biosynthesis protein UbiJ